MDSSKTEKPERSRGKRGRFALDGWRDGEQPNEPVLASGFRITARELEAVDALILANGVRDEAGLAVGSSRYMIEYHVRNFCRKLGLRSPRGLQAMLYRAKMLGAMEALNGMRHTRGYAIRDLYEASISIGPDHPLFDYIHPPRFTNGRGPSVSPQPGRLRRNK